MRRVFSGVVTLIVSSSLAIAGGVEVETQLAGRWDVKFENGVVEWSSIGNEHTASVIEARRNSPGKTESTNGSLLIVYKGW